MSFKYKTPDEEENNNADQDALFLTIRNALIVIVLSIIVLSIIFAPTPSYAKSIYQQKMYRLNDINQSVSQVQTLTAYKGNPMLTAFFMPNCRWCQRQHKVLKKLQHTCPAIQTVMLGVQGSKQKLRLELQREKNNFPAFLANNNILQAIGAKSPVPMMLLFNHEGSLVFKTLGYTPEEKLTTLLAQHNIKACYA